MLVAWRQNGLYSAYVILFLFTRCFFPSSLLWPVKVITHQLSRSFVFLEQKRAGTIPSLSSQLSDSTTLYLNTASNEKILI